MTQHDLALATGMPQPSIARIEAGTVIPRTETLIAILSATGYRLSVEPIDPAVDREAIRRQLAMDVPRRTMKTGRVLRRLRRFAVPFVLIGDLAEVAHGSPIKVGRVIEICVASTEIAQDRLRAALEDLSTTTDAGRLRVLTETPAGDTYDVLARNAVQLHVEAGFLVPVAALEDLIRSRRAAGTQQGREAATVLEAIIEETRPRTRGAVPKGPSAPAVRDR
jgi:transcriptional regulator with XRE-family HTH domain